MNYIEFTYHSSSGAVDSNRRAEPKADAAARRHCSQSLNSPALPNSKINLKAEGEDCIDLRDTPS